MAFRGRGRSRGRGRGGSFEFRMAKHEPFVLFPEDVNLPNVSIFENLSNEEKMLIGGKVKLERFWKTSSYYLEDSKKQDAEVEQYAEKLRRKGQQLQNLGTYTKLNVSYFPAELIQGEKRGHVDSKRPRWDTKQDEFSLFEKLEEKAKDRDGKDNNEKEKKEGDEETEEDLEKEEVESSEDDYAQNEYFDDDEDDFNIEEEPGKVNKFSQKFITQKQILLLKPFVFKSSERLF